MKRISLLPVLLVLLALLALLFSSWLMFHTFSYDSATHEFRIAFKLWSDFGAHIPLIRSFSMGPNFDRLIHFQTIEYPIYPGEPIRYHFIFDMIVGLLEKAGLRIDWALNIPSIIGFTLLLVAIYLLAKKLFHSTSVGLLSVVFFLFNGSLAFLQFFELHPLSLSTLADILKAKDFPAFAPWGPGDITAFWNLNIYTNQRHLAGAFALILFFIITCLKIEHKPINKQLPWAIVWAILIGILPFYHQPTLLIVAVLMVMYFILFPALRRFLFATGLCAMILVLPQLFIAKGTGSTAEWFPGYIIHNDIEKLSVIKQIIRMSIFWWNNLGLHSILILFGFFLIPKQARNIMLPIIPIFLIGNLFKFSVEVSANHKFFNFVMILGQMISANTLVLLFQKIKQYNRHWLIGLLDYWIIGLFIMFLTLSGFIDFFVIANDTKGSASDIPTNEVAGWIAKNTPKDAVFLNSSYLYHPASIAGRSVFLGWPYFAWSAGYDSYDRMAETKILYSATDKEKLCDILSKNNISYVTYQSNDLYAEIPFSNEAYYNKYFPVMYQRELNNVHIYDVQSCYQ